MVMHRQIGLKQGEEIVAIVRRSPVTYGWLFFLIGTMATGTFFFMFWFLSQGILGQLGFIALLGITILLSLLFIFIHYRNVCYITTHRICDIQRDGLFDTIVSDVPYDQIEDVSGRITGFWGMLLRYGEVKIQSAAGTVQVIVSRIRYPIRIQQLINNIREDYLHERNQKALRLSAPGIVQAIQKFSLGELRTISAALKRRIEELETDEDGFSHV